MKGGYILQINEVDKVEFTDDNGVTIELEIVDYFLFDGQEYVILADTNGVRVDEKNETEEVDVFVMRVDVIDDDNEEFAPLTPLEEDKVNPYATKFLANELPDEAY